MNQVWHSNVTEGLKIWPSAAVHTHERLIWKVSEKRMIMRIVCECNLLPLVKELNILGIVEHFN
jgi:hypothetical protein